MLHRVILSCGMVLLCLCGSVVGEPLRLRSADYSLSIAGATGTGLRLVDLKRNVPLLVSGGVGWELSNGQGKCLESAGRGAESARGKDSLVLTWKSPKARVQVELALHDRDGLAMRMIVANEDEKPITEIIFPTGVEIDQRRFEELIVDDHIGPAGSMERWCERGGTLGDGIPYPSGHADVLVARGKGKLPSVGFACPHTEPLLTPSRMWYGKTGDHVGSFRHRFFVWIPQGKTWTSPYLHAFSAKDVFDAFSKYRRMLGLDKARTLREKWGKNFDLAAKAPVLKYECAWYGGKAIRDFAAMTKDLPSPLIYEPVEYWPSKFDDHYPDYFPINANLGTDEDFRRMIDTAHARGSLVMPFFSPAHWSVGSPSTLKVGEQVAARDEKNQPIMYDGRPNYGLNYFVTGWNKHVPARAAENLREFRAIGCDAAFADIVGNMYKEWDLNPATPNPRAYFAGMIRLGEVMAKELPMTTEGGSDIHSRNFAGMFQFFLKVKYKFTGFLPWKASDGYDDGWANKNNGKDKVVRLFPMNTALASGLAMVYPHNLGPPILEQEMLNDSLAMGMGLYMTYEKVTSGHLAWLKYQHFLQQEVVRYYFGQPMIGFDYVAGYDDVSVTRWPGMELYVNHPAKPVTVRIGHETQTMAPFAMIWVLMGQAKVIPTFEEWKKP